MIPSFAELAVVVVLVWLGFPRAVVVAPAGFFGGDIRPSGVAPWVTCCTSKEASTVIALWASSRWYGRYEGIET